MARGFNITVQVATDESFDEKALESEIKANGQLSEDESKKYLAGAFKAAKALIDAIGEGPYQVNLHGVDHSTEDGETTDIGVSVESRYTKTPEELTKAAAATAPASTGEAPQPTEQVNAFSATPSEVLPADAAPGDALS